MPADCAADAPTPLWGNCSSIRSVDVICRDLWHRRSCRQVQWWGHPKAGRREWLSRSLLSRADTRSAALPSHKIKRRPTPPDMSGLIPRRQLPVVRRFNLFGRHPKWKSAFPALVLFRGDERLCRFATTFAGLRQLQSRCGIALHRWMLGGALQCCLPRLCHDNWGAGHDAAGQWGQY